MKFELIEKEIFKYRPKPFYFLTTQDESEYTKEKITESLKDLKECGFGGFVLFNKPPCGFDNESYLSDKWFRITKTFCECAKELGLEVWINDGFDYPPGNAGGRIEKVAPELKQKRLVKKDGRLVVEDVEWGFPAFEEKKSGELFVHFVHEKYKKVVGEYFGNTIKGFFSDADNRRLHPLVMFSEDHPARNYFPWASDFSETFKQKYGYDIMPYMSDVMDRKPISQAVDYWEHAGQRYHVWFENNAKWLKENNLLYTGHSGDTSPFTYDQAPRSSCFTEGRFSDAQRYFDYPGTDQELLALDGGKHMRITKWYAPKVIFGEKFKMQKMTDYYDVTEDLRAKQAASTAFMYGKKEVMCEMFAASNFGVSAAELYQIALFQVMQGVTMIVPHAYHYRFHKETKYFAPPEFSSRGAIGEYVNELNTNLAEMTCLMSKGKSICPIALLAPTEAVWKNQFNSKEYFDCFAKLNRKPWGYTICSLNELIENDYGFKLVVIAGFEISKEDKEKIAKKGIEIFKGIDEQAIDELIDCKISYQGEGTPHFVRKVIDGEPTLVFANVENPGCINGTITAFGRREEISLWTGDWGYISKNHEKLPQKPKTGALICDIPNVVNASFMEENILPLECFVDQKGNTVSKSSEVRLLTCGFSTLHNLNRVKLYIPQECRDIIEDISFDGIKLSSRVDGKVYDDLYDVYSLPAISVGEHKVVINKLKPINYFDRIFLMGEFDVDIKTDGQEGEKILSVYNMTVNLPKTASVTLSSRSDMLKTNLSWAEQGQPFYSGKTIYRFSVNLPDDGEYALDLDELRDTVYLSVNGKEIGRKIKPYYFFEFSGRKGENSFEIIIQNTLANAMEYYKEESGLTKGGKIIKL